MQLKIERIYLHIRIYASRKDKTNTKDITQRFLFGLFDLSVMAQIIERVYSKVITFLIASDWCLSIIVTNVFLHLILKN